MYIFTGHKPLKSKIMKKLLFSVLVLGVIAICQRDEVFGEVAPETAGIAEIAAVVNPTMTLVVHNAEMQGSVYVYQVGDRIFMEAVFDCELNGEDVVVEWWGRNGTIVHDGCDTVITTTYNGYRGHSTLEISSAGFFHSGPFGCIAGVPGSGSYASAQCQVVVTE